MEGRAVQANCVGLRTASGTREVERLIDTEIEQRRLGRQ